MSAAVIEDHGRYFVTRRQQGAHLEGYWEFPGGKCEDGEPLDACLRRELKEELGAERHDRRRDLHRDARRIQTAQSGAALLRVRVPQRAGAAARPGDALGAPRGVAIAAVPARRRGADRDAGEDATGLTRYSSGSAVTIPRASFDDDLGARLHEIAVHVAEARRDEPATATTRRW